MGLDPADFLQAVATTLHYPWLPSSLLFASTPDFSIIPLTKALQRECTVVRLATGETVGVFADPFDAALVAWLDARLAGAPLYLAHPEDVAALLARHEETFRAVQSVHTGHDVEARAAVSSPVETLSTARKLSSWRASSAARSAGWAR